MGAAYMQAAMTPNGTQGTEKTAAEQEEGKRIPELKHLSDRKAESVQSPSFEYVTDKKAGTTKKLYGYVNEKGKFVIPPVFDEAEPFVGDMAWVKADGLYGMINKHADYVIVPTFSELTRIGNRDLFFVRENGLYGVFNQQGEQVWAPQFFELHSTQNREVYRVKNEGKYGVIDLQGNYVLQPVFTEFRPIVQDQFFLATQDGLQGLYSADFKEMIPCELTALYPKEEGFLMVGPLQRKKFTTYQTALAEWQQYGMVLNSCRYDELHARGICKRDGKYGIGQIIKGEWQETVACEYDYAYTLNDDSTYVIFQKGKYYYPAFYTTPWVARNNPPSAYPENIFVSEKGYDKWEWNPAYPDLLFLRDYVYWDVAFKNGYEWDVKANYLTRQPDMRKMGQGELFWEYGREPYVLSSYGYESLRDYDNRMFRKMTYAEYEANPAIPQLLKRHLREKSTSCWQYAIIDTQENGILQQVVKRPGEEAEYHEIIGGRTYLEEPHWVNDTLAKMEGAVFASSIFSDKNEYDVFIYYKDHHFYAYHAPSNRYFSSGVNYLRPEEVDGEQWFYIDVPNWDLGRGFWQEFTVINSNLLFVGYGGADMFTYNLERLPASQIGSTPFAHFTPPTQPTYSDAWNIFGLRGHVKEVTTQVKVMESEDPYFPTTNKNTRSFTREGMLVTTEGDILKRENNQVVWQGIREDVGGDMLELGDTYEYYPNGLIRHIVGQWYESFAETDYLYNEQNDLEYIMENGGVEGTLFRSSCEYEYISFDQYGNWLSRKCIRIYREADPINDEQAIEQEFEASQTKTITIETRTITYY